MPADSLYSIGFQSTSKQKFLLINSSCEFFTHRKKFNFVIMQFDSYISDLLYRYDCVIVPEFGAFLSHTVSAEINGNTFYPPKKILSCLLYTSDAADD